MIVVYIYTFSVSTKLVVNLSAYEIEVSLNSHKIQMQQTESNVFDVKSVQMVYTNDEGT